MRKIDVFDATNSLSQLLDQVEQGETIVITRHRKPVAQLIPYREFDQERVRAAVAALLRFQGGQLPEGVTLRGLIGEGRC
jgi:prevent-host-death family protein